MSFGAAARAHMAMIFSEKQEQRVAEEQTDITALAYDPQRLQSERQQR